MRFAITLLLCGLLAGLPAQAVTVIAGQLTTADLLASDTVGDFHYDPFAVTVAQATTVQVGLTSPHFATWVALWATPVLPARIWEDGALVDLYADALMIEAAPVNQVAGFSFAAQQGVTYHLAVATNAYLPVQMGDYTLTLSAQDLGSGLMVSSVPEPSTWALGLLGLAAVLRVASRRRVGG